MVVPGGTYLAMDGQMRAAKDGLSDPGRHHHCPASRIRSTKHQENHFLAGIKKAAWGEAAWGSFKCLKEGGMRVA